VLYLRLCFDRAGSTELREARRTYIESHVSGDEPAKAKVILAGPLCVSDSDETNVASMMIVEAGSLDVVLEFHDRDLFTVNGLYERADISLGQASGLGASSAHLPAIRKDNNGQPTGVRGETCILLGSSGPKAWNCQRRRDY
jgi:hypothetical protein